MTICFNTSWWTDCRMNDERMTITAISAKAELANMLAHWLVKLLVQPIIIKKKKLLRVMV